MAGDGAFSLSKALGEYFREASVLVLVFGFLDPLVSGQPATNLTEHLSNIRLTWALFVLYAINRSVYSRFSRRMDPDPMNYTFLAVLSVMAALLAVPMLLLAAREARQRRKAPKSAAVETARLITHTTGSGVRVWKRSLAARYEQNLHTVGILQIAMEQVAKRVESLPSVRIMTVVEDESRRNTDAAVQQALEWRGRQSRRPEA